MSWFTLGHIDIGQQYLPWVRDVDFHKAFDSIKGNTLLGERKAWTIWTVLSQVLKISSAAVIEVGCCNGGISILMDRAIKKFGSENKLFVCDTFSGIPKKESN